MKKNKHKRGLGRKVGRKVCERRQDVGPRHRDLPEILRDARQDLRTLVMVRGMEMFQQMLEDDRTALCGVRHAPDPERGAYRYGYDDGVLIFGGRKVRLRKPRVRHKAGGEATLPTWMAYTDSDPLGKRVVDQMMIGVSTRKYERSLEGAPGGTSSVGIDRSSVSRTFVARTEQAVKEFLSRPLKSDDFPVIMIDGKTICGHVMLIALGVDREGRKHILGLEEGTTENSEVCKSLLGDLITRGLEVAHRRLVVIDGGKGLRRAVKDTFGAWALVQRCRVHKLRNVIEHLPAPRQAAVIAALKKAWGSANVDQARKLLRQLANHVRQEHPGAAGSIEEGLDETLTVLALGLDGHLLKLFSSTNMIENVNGTVQDMTRRVKRWRGGAMVMRWAATGLMEAERNFRRIAGYEQLPTLIASLNSHSQSSVSIKRAVNE